MKLLENYNDALIELYEHVGFKEDWVVFPISDCTEYFWDLVEKDSLYDCECVKYAETIEKFDSDGDFYSDKIEKQRFYEKLIYKGKDLTMIFCNPGVDGMRYFSFFDNSKRLDIKTQRRNKLKSIENEIHL